MDEVKVPQAEHDGEPSRESAFHDLGADADPPASAPVVHQVPQAVPAKGPNWWHRDHPVFTPLSGFYTGLLLAVVIPGAFGALLSQVFGAERAEDLFPFSVLVLAVPMVLIAMPRTRRFGLYLGLGMVLTAAVVIVVALATVAVLYRGDLG